MAEDIRVDIDGDTAHAESYVLFVQRFGATRD